MGGDRFGSETDGSERKLREMEVWMLRYERDKLMEEISDKDRKIQELTEERDLVLKTDIVNKVMDMVQRELESKQCVLDVANRARDENEHAKASHECKITELRGEVGRVKDVVDELKGSFRDLEKKNEQLLSQVHIYMNVADEVILEKEKTNVEELELQVAGMKKRIEQADTELEQMKSEREQELNERHKDYVDAVDLLKRTFREFDEENETLHAQVHYYRNVVDEVLEKEKTNVEELELQVAGMKERIEQADTELKQMRSEREKLNERNKELENYVDVLKKEMDELHNTLLEALRECFSDDSDDSSDESIEYPDTDFNDFGKERKEDCFAVNQFWAIYDDGLPRDYGLVRNVYSASPFKLKITWLVPDPDDQGEIDWDDAELPIACGKFKLGASESVTDLRIFSHQIKCMKTIGKGSYMVYPKKGETWAIFRDWDIKWSSNPENHLTDEFGYVEILSDFTKNIFIEVAYLAKVKGFVSLFQRTEKNGVNISCVLPNELYRFSHQIPSYKMTGNEREGVPRGSFEFDTAALPTKFFEAGDSS